MSKPATLEQHLCFALYSALNHVTALYRPLLNEHDITYTQYLVLTALWVEDNVSISQLAKAVEISKATMTPLIKRMEQKGLIKVKRLNNNDRQKNILLTEKGDEISKYTNGIIREVFAQIDLTVEQKTELVGLCFKITERKVDI